MSIEIRVFNEPNPLDYTRYCRVYCTRCHTTTIHRKRRKDPQDPLDSLKGYKGLVRVCRRCGREVRFSERVRTTP